MASFSESSGSSQGSSQSTSTPVAVHTAQSDWGLMQSQLYSMIADELQVWAEQQYAKGENVTNQAVDNLMKLSGEAKGFAGRLINQYDQQIRPAMDQYFREAGSYASAERQAFEAGQAISDVSQAHEAAIDAMESRLSSYGADPNSGRWMKSVLGEATGRASAMAGAGTMAAERTAETGRQMLGQYINWGQNVPGFAMNAINASYAGLTAAENAILGLLNTGKNLMELPIQQRNTAVAANKLPPVGQQSQSSSQQSSQNKSQSQQKDKDGGDKQQKEPGQGKGPGEGGGRGGGDGEGGGRGIADAPRDPGGIRPETEPYDAQTGTGRDPGYYGAVPYFDETGTVRTEFDPGLGRDSSGDLLTPETQDWDNTPQAPNWRLPDDYMPGSGFNVDPGVQDMPQPGIDPMGGWNDDINPFASYPDNPFVGDDTPSSPMADWQGQLDDMSYGDDPYQQASYDDQNDYSYDPGEDYSDWTETGDDYQNSDYDFSDYDSDVTDAGYDNYDYGFDDYSGYDDYSYDDYSGYDDYDYGYDDYGGDYGGGYDDYGGDYQRGGAVRRPRMQARGRGIVPTSGGAVPRSASPSRGRQTDDISARLNAGEYVIPKDVVSHKGTEFFNNLIEKSRKLRTGMAGPKPGAKMKRPLRTPPTFTSRQLPAR